MEESDCGVERYAVIALASSLRFLCSLAGYYFYLLICCYTLLAINVCTLQIGVELAKLFRSGACR